MTYLFMIGRTPELSQAEVTAVLSLLAIPFELQFVSDAVVAVEVTEPLPCQMLVDRLGGTVKIAQLVGSFLSDSQTEEAVAEIITNALKSETSGKRVTFGVSLVGQVANISLVKLSKKIKDELEADSILSRYVLPKDGQISSVVVTKERLCEFLCVVHNEKLLVARTQAVQRFAAWSHRDWDRPAVDPKSGMLPPKVARMMVNVGIARLADKQSPLILDPFCGSGTILAEAMMLGCSVVGCDKSEQAAKDTKENLTWLSKEYQLAKERFHVFTHDATKRLPTLRHLPDLIVTEPYLGPPLRRPLVKNQAVQLAQRLGQMYEQFFVAQHDWLPGHAVIVCALPLLLTQDNQTVGISLIDNCEKVGYTLVAGPYNYSRPGARVARQIVILEKQ